MTKRAQARRTAGAIFVTSALAGVTALTTGAGVAEAGTPSACDASTLSLSILGGSTVAADRANPSSTPCVSDIGSADLSVLGGTATASLVAATTTQAAGTSATAHSQVAGLHVGTSSFTSSLVAPLTSGANSILPSIDSALSGQFGSGGGLNLALAPLIGLGLNLNGVSDSKLATQVGGQLPAALNTALPDILNAGVIAADASATCSTDPATLAGSTALTGVNVLGTTVDANDPAGKVLSVDTANVTLSQLVSVNDLLKSITATVPQASALGLLVTPGTYTLYDLLVNPTGLVGTLTSVLPAGTVGTVVNGLSSALAPVISGTSIPLPTGVLHAVVTPRTETNDGTTITETALSLDVTALSQPILSGSLAHASVTTAAAECGITPTPSPTPSPSPGPTPSPGPSPSPTPDPSPSPDPNPTPDPAPTPTPISVTPTPTPTPSPTPVPVTATATAGASASFSDKALQCSDARLRLIEVRPSEGKAFVQGVAKSEFVGQTATIYLTYGNKKVGSAKVAANGVFSTRVPLPPASIAATNSARYYAVISGKRTAALKFARRMVTTRLVSRAGTVTFGGRTTLPRAKHQAAIAIQERISCTAYKTVAHTRPDSRGNFSVTFAATKGETSAVYRAQTQVPKYAHSKTLFETFTLPKVLTIRW